MTKQSAYTKTYDKTKQLLQDAKLDTAHAYLGLLIAVRPFFLCEDSHDDVLFYKALDILKQDSLSYIQRTEGDSLKWNAALNMQRYHNEQRINDIDSLLKYLKESNDYV